jgi:ribosome-associated protein
MIVIAAGLTLDEGELQESFIRASGPGGQNVNKVATAVQLRWDVRNSPSISDAVRERLMRLAANRINSDGILLIEARRFRTQDKNRQDARERLVAILREAIEPPKPRRATRPTKAARQSRVENKRRRAQIKKLRRTSGTEREW